MIVIVVRGCEPFAVKMRYRIVLSLLVPRYRPVRMGNCCQLAGEESENQDQGNAASKHQMQLTFLP